MNKFFILFFISFTAFANDLILKDYNWNLTDIADRRISRSQLFSSMDRKFITTKSSICSNRALMWANDFKEQYKIDTGKIFLFYTKKKGEISLRTWWYHVAPVINENGSPWVMDAGFSGYIGEPKKITDWLKLFANSSNCKEIGSHETELVELIFYGQTFPRQTSYGNYDCYYKVVPHTIWTPEILAMNILGRTHTGERVSVERPEIEKEELYQACLEATTTKIEYALGTNKKRCRSYANIAED